MSECPHCSSFVSKGELIDECTECGIGRSKNVTAAFDGQNYVAKIEQEIKSKQLYHRAVFARCLKNCSLKNKNVLEIGCSDAYFLQFLKKKRKDWNMRGLDPYVNLQLASGSISVFQVRFEDFQSTDKYGLIIMLHVLEHMSDPLPVLRKCRELLDEEGRLLITVPNYGSWWAKATKEEWPWLNTREHYYHYTRKGLCRILEQQGFRALSVKSYTRFDGWGVPVFLNLYFLLKGFYSKGIFSIWPLRPLIYRLINFLRRPLNLFVELSGNGAEIQVLAEKLRT